MMPPSRQTREGVRLWDLKDGQRVAVTCICGRITHFLPGVLQRLHKMPSDTLVYDLRYGLRCQKCRSRARNHLYRTAVRWP